jgi:hypothetical protein
MEFILPANRHAKNPGDARRTAEIEFAKDATLG